MTARKFTIIILLLIFINILYTFSSIIYMYVCLSIRPENKKSQIKQIMCLCRNIINQTMCHHN